MPLFPQEGGDADEQGEQEDPGRYPPEEMSPGFLLAVGDRGQCPGNKTKHTGRIGSVDVMFFGFISQAAETEFEQVGSAHL